MGGGRSSASSASRSSAAEFSIASRPGRGSATGAAVGGAAGSGAAPFSGGDGCCCGGSSKPGGRIDSGVCVSWLSAGMAMARKAAPERKSSLLRQRCIRHVLLDPLQGNLAVNGGKEDRAANQQHGETDQDRRQRRAAAAGCRKRRIFAHGRPF